MSKIAVLPPEEARKIAAGEVIDRPAALIREFIDNAVDARAGEIEARIEGGGAKRTEVIDDGEGMDREDLLSCVLTHATSKIRSLEDLNTAKSLGFRGEALAAAAAVSRLEILSNTGGGETWLLRAGPGENNPPVLEQGRRKKGSSVRALFLFDTIPARKRFLKREGSEAALCRQIFLDKAMAFPGLCFRFVQDGELRDFLPSRASHKERFAAALFNGQTAFLHEIKAAGEGFTINVVFGGPERSRNDRRRQYVFANGRRIQDYSLIQALEYGLSGFFPNGTRPVGALFLDIDPRLADFNIHPAKREARFSDPGAIHHAITSALRNYTRRFFLGFSPASAPEDGGEYAVREHSGWKHPAGEPLFGGGAEHSAEDGFRKDGQNHFSRENAAAAALAMEALLNNPPDFERRAGAEEETGDSPLKIAGRCFGVFIIAEAGENLYIIDQHAAHERVLYNRFMTEPVIRQELLSPILFHTASDEEDRFLETKREELFRLGIAIKKGSGYWSIESLPSGWELSDRETVRKLLDLRDAGENMAERWAATLSCHRAVRDGDWLGEEASRNLVREALNLPDPRCPHGRPVWIKLNRESLFKSVKRR